MSAENPQYPSDAELIDLLRRRCSGVERAVMKYIDDVQPAGVARKEAFEHAKVVVARLADGTVPREVTEFLEVYERTTAERFVAAKELLDALISDFHLSVLCADDWPDDERRRWFASPPDPVPPLVSPTDKTLGGEA